MNPAVGRWLLESIGDEVGPPSVQHALGLSKVVPLLAPLHTGLLKNAHDAGYDAQMTRWVYDGLVEHARAARKPEILSQGEKKAPA